MKIRLKYQIIEDMIQTLKYVYTNRNSLRYCKREREKQDVKDYKFIFLEYLTDI